MSPTPPAGRHRRPTVYVAYGATGGAWLRSLSARLSNQDDMRALIERRVIQFWCVGPAGIGQPIISVGRDATPEQLDGLLDAARAARVAAEISDLDARHVLIVERVALFDEQPDAASACEGFRRVMATVRLENLDPSSAHSRFEYDWTVLADATRGPERPTPDRASAARRLIEGAPPRGRTFFVDRQDAGSAVIDPDLANQAFLPLAVALAASDVGARRVDVSRDRVPNLLWEEAGPGSLIPFAVLELSHPAADVEMARARSLLARLVRVGQDLDLRAATATLGSPNALVECARQDVVAAASPPFDAHAARQRRRDAAAALLAWAIVEGSLTDAQARLMEVRRAIVPLDQWLTPVRPMAAIPSSVSAPALALLQPGAPERDWLPWALGIAVVAGIGAAVFLRARRVPAPQEPALSVHDEAERAAARRELAREWGTTLDRLERLLDAWFLEGRTAPRATARSAGSWQSDPPFAWRLQNVGAQGDDGLVTPRSCRDLAGGALDRVADGVPADDALLDAARTILRRATKLAEANQAFAALRDVLGEALEESQSAALQRAAASARILAHTAASGTPEAVVWLAHPALELETPLLQHVEPAVTRDDARTAMLTHDDEGRSVRIAFARPLSWEDVISLDALRTS